MRSIDERFYKSKAWKNCRADYIAQHPLCEDCLGQGLYTPAKHVHHIIWLNETNVTNPEISLNWRNLRALCHECHNKEHARKHKRRYTVDEHGRITAHE